MPKGVPDRCDPPSSSPLINSWTAPVIPTTTATPTPPPTEEVGIVIPPSGLLCGQVVVTTEPPLDDEEVRACVLYSVVALDNERTAIISSVSCQSRETETHFLAPNSCLYVYSLSELVVVDPGFGDIDQPTNGTGAGTGTGSEDNNPEDPEDPEEEEVVSDPSITEDTDGDGIPDRGVIIDPEDCVVVGPAGPEQEETWVPLPGGGDGETEDGNNPDNGTTLSDAGTGGGNTGQPGPSGTTSGPVYNGPEPSGMFCGGDPSGVFDIEDESYLNPPSSLKVKLALVGAGNVQDSVVFKENGVQLEETLRPNAVYMYEDASTNLLEDDPVYTSYVVDKPLRTIVDSSGEYTYQLQRESAFQTPRQIPVQNTYEADPANLTLLWDNYKNNLGYGKPSYAIVESVIDDSGSFKPRYSFILSDGYQFTPGASYNNNAIIVLTAPESTNPSQRTPKFVVDRLDFASNNFATLAGLIPKSRSITIDYAKVYCPEFFSWHMNSGIPAGYGWDSGSYRLFETETQFTAETGTTLEHKLIPINFDDNYRITEESKELLRLEDEWVPRYNSEEDDDIEFNSSQLEVMDSFGWTWQTIYMEVVKCVSFTRAANYRPDGTHYMYGNDLRIFPKLIKSEQTKRSVFTFGPSGEFINLRDWRDGQLFTNIPNATFLYPTNEVLVDQSRINESDCFTSDDESDLDGNITLDYWDTDFNMVSMIRNSGDPYSQSVVTRPDCSPFAVQQNIGYDTYQDFVAAGSGYVPMNFYPCTITDKIESIRSVYNKPASTGGGGGGGGDNGEIGLNGMSRIVSEGYWTSPHGCYELFQPVDEQEPLYKNGKRYYKYNSDQVPEPELPDLTINYEIYYDGTQWVLKDMNYYSTTFSTSSDDNGLYAPTTGWTLDYEINSSSCYN